MNISGKSRALCILLMTLLFCSCAKGKPADGQKGRLVGQQQLSGDNLRQQAIVLKKKVTLEPANANANFSYGRVLLAMKQSRQALPYFEKAATLVPDNAEYLFWQGVAYGENKKSAKERLSYQRALQYDEKHEQALVYLGNNYLSGKAYQPALDCYQRALAISPDNAQALYNRAIICKQLRRTPEEALAWRLYLASYPSGLLARKAADHLNSHEDFSFRNHYIGPRILTLPALEFLPFGDELTPSAMATLDQVGTAANRLRQGNLDILVYQKNNRELARKRAISIKKYLDDRFEVLKVGKRIRLSWFDVPEKRNISGRSVKIDESVVFLLADQSTKKKNKEKKKIKKSS